MARSGLDPIFRIEVHVRTGGSPEAGTDGEVYLIFAGREFNLNLAAVRDRRPATTDHYRLGDVPSTDPDETEPNVENPFFNNPRGLAIHLAWDHPIGLRLAPQLGLNPPDRWQLEHCWMSVYTNDGYEDLAYLDGSLTRPPLWLGQEGGLTVYLEREIQSEDRDPLKHKQEEEYRGEAPQSSTQR